MAKRRRLWIALACVAAVGGVLWYLARSSLGPDYRGKPLGAWLETGFTSDVAYDKTWQEPGAYPGALHVLVKALKRQNTKWQRRYQTNYVRMPKWLQRHLPQPVTVDATVVRQNAIYVLSLMRDNAKPAIPDIIYTLKHDSHSNTRQAAITCLWIIAPDDPSVKRALQDVSQDADPEVRTMAGNVLKAMEKQAMASTGVYLSNTNALGR